MTDARHTPLGNRSFLASLLTNVGGGLALIALTAGAFWGVGQLRQPEAGNPVIDQPTDGVAAGDPTEGTTPQPPASETPTTEAPPADDPTAAETPPPEGEPTQRFAPAEISLQVLDAAGDGGARARAAADQLEAAGYQVVAVNRAIRTYEQSTVFYTEGHEAEAEQFVATNSEFVVDPDTPTNLSDTVDLHVIVGEDYPEPD